MKKLLLFFLLMLLTTNYCWTMQADPATEQSAPWYKKWLPWTKKQQKFEPKKVQESVETKDASQPQSQVPDVLGAPKPDDHKAPKSPDGKDAKRVEPQAQGFPHPWANQITVPQKDPLETEELDHKLCESVLEAFHEPRENKHYLLIKQLVIDGANPIIIWQDLKNQYKEEETWRYIVYAMNVGLIENRVKPFGSCGKSDCYLPEYVLLLTAPAGATLPLEKTKVIEILPELLDFCNDPRMHYINAGGPLTLLLSDCIFFETDPTLVPHYKKLRYILNTRFNRKIFLRDVYQSAVFDVQMAGGDKTTFLKKEGIDYQRVLRLEEAADGTVIEQKKVVTFTDRPIKKKTMNTPVKNNTSKKQSRNPWQGFNGIKLAQKDIPVNKEYDAQLLQCVEVIAQGAQYKNNKKYTNIRDLIACGGNPDYVQALITTIINQELKDDARLAAVRATEFAVNMGLLQARVNPFGKCSDDKCYLPHYIVMLLASNGAQTPVNRDAALSKIPKLLAACPDHAQHHINGKTVVTRIKEILTNTGRSKEVIERVRGQLMSNFPDLGF